MTVVTVLVARFGRRKREIIDVKTGFSRGIMVAILSIMVSAPDWFHDVVGILVAQDYLYIPLFLNSNTLYTDRVSMIGIIRYAKRTVALVVYVNMSIMGGKVYFSKSI